MYTKVNKPGAQTYTGVNTAKPSYDEQDLSYDESTIYYDGFNQAQYTNVSKPLGTTISSTNAPGTMADDATIGTQTWSNVNNAKVSDNIYSTVSFTISTISHYLKATNFGFSIPIGSVIVGILVGIEQKRTSVLFENAIKIVKSDGTFGSVNKSTGATLPGADKFVFYGGETDLWGETWTVNDIINANFGVGFSVLEGGFGGGRTASVDFMNITVYYNPPTRTYTNVLKPTT